MSVNQIDKIDFISTRPDKAVILTISDHLPWDNDNEHLLILQDKVNSYLHFIETGQIVELYPQAKQAILVISVALKYSPSGDSLSFLNRCKEIVEKDGIQFEWQVIVGE